MTFQDSIRVCFTKYADFNGRAGRPEYWWFALFILIGSLVLSKLSPTLGGVFSLATLLPSIAAAARRLHDTNRSGWWQLIVVLPLIGIIVLVMFLTQAGRPASAVEAV